MPITTESHSSEFLSFLKPDDFHRKFPFAKDRQKIHQGLEVPETGIYRCATCWHEALMIKGRTIQSEHVTCCHKTKRELIVHFEKKFDWIITCLSEKSYWFSSSHAYFNPFFSGRKALYRTDLKSLKRSESFN